MEQVIVKTDGESEDQILLFYVDENGHNEQSVLTTVDRLQHEEVQNQDEEIENVYITPEIEENVYEPREVLMLPEQVDEIESPDQWSENETKQLLVFYIDNKETFLSGSTKKNVLWSVVCKAILTEKTATSCDLKLTSLKKKYVHVLITQRNGVIVWPYFELAHQAFFDDPYVTTTLSQADMSDLQVQMVETSEYVDQDNVIEMEVPMEMDTMNDENADVPEITITADQVNDSIGNIEGMGINIQGLGCVIQPKRTVDQKAEKMLKLYLKHKKNLCNIQKEYWQKGLWETIVKEMGEQDPDYWHKRFLNYKQHYLTLLEKQEELGPQSIKWPYMDLFNQIYQNDPEFQKKVTRKLQRNYLPEQIEVVWRDSDLVQLSKYYFDSFHEFEDPTIPDNFLWNEIARILGKTPESCRDKYLELKTSHINRYIEGYSLRSRNALCIILDNIIFKEVLVQFRERLEVEEDWTEKDTNILVSFFYENIELLKDEVCYFVCWVAVSLKLEKSIVTCYNEWVTLRTTYQSILADKNDSPDVTVDWCYNDMFDRIFDYGMDVNLLNGYESKYIEENAENEKTPSQTVKVKTENSITPKNKRSKPKISNENTIRLLEYYHKHKDRLYNGKNNSLWNILGKEINMTAQECTDTLKELEKTYISYVEKEVYKKQNVTWPHYQLCKKTFGYRSLRSKFRKSKPHSDDDSWSDGEVAILIKFLTENFETISNSYDQNIWIGLSEEINRTVTECHEKYIELRKSYRKLRTMRLRKPTVKVTWKYFQAFDDIYNSGNVESLDFDEYEQLDNDLSKELQEDDDIQCIIVIPEENGTTKPQKTRKWTKKSKKQLLLLLIKYITKHCNEEIDSRNMWREISASIKHKTPKNCRQMALKLKKNRMNKVSETEFDHLIDKVLALKPKFKKLKSVLQTNVFENVEVPSEKLELALKYYLDNIIEFVSPMYEKNVVWSHLAKSIDVPVNKIYNKINYLKQNLDKNVEFESQIKEIVEKEVLVRNSLDFVERQCVDIWSDDEIEVLLNWYLTNLDKFKNPKYVRKYLWIQASNLLNKTALGCSKMMLDIRTQYRTFVKEKASELKNWRFHELCEKIYGKGKLRA